MPAMETLHNLLSAVPPEVGYTINQDLQFLILLLPQDTHTFSPLLVSTRARTPKETRHLSLTLHKLNLSIITRPTQTAMISHTPTPEARLTAPARVMVTTTLCKPQQIRHHHLDLMLRRALVRTVRQVDMVVTIAETTQATISSLT